MSNYITPLKRLITLMARAVQVFCLILIIVATYNIVFSGKAENGAFGVEEIVGGSIIFVAASLLSWGVKAWLTNFEG